MISRLITKFGRSMANHLRTELVLAPLATAIGQRKGLRRHPSLGSEKSVHIPGVQRSLQAGR